METSQESRAWEQIIQNSLDIIGTMGRDGIFLNINEACISVLGYSPEEIRSHHFSNFVYSEDLESTVDIIQGIICGVKIKNFKNQCLHKNGNQVTLLWSAAWSEQEQAILIVGRDITEQEQARKKEEVYQTLIELGSDMLALFDKDLNFLFAEGSILKELGYKAEQLVGTSALAYIHPDDIPVVKEIVKESLFSGGTINIPEYRFRNAHGEWRWLETKGSNQLQNPSIEALLGNSRDITERVENRIKLQESEQRFKSLFEHHLDIVLFQNKEGVIIDVNNATLSFYGVQKQEIINKPFSDFLPAEIIPVCERALQDSLKGKPVRLELAIPFEGKGTCTFEAVKIPVVVEGDIIGVYTFLRDVTEINRSNRIIKRQAEKLNTIFESITDAVFTLDRNWNFTYINKEFDNLLHTSREQLIGKNIWKVLPEEVNGVFFRHYFHAIETGRAVHFDAYFEKLGVWLQVKAFPSEEGLSVYFDDITEKVKSKQELEKLSLVASKTINGVIILDAEMRAEWVNEGFERLTGFTLSDVIGKDPGSILHGKEVDSSLRKEVNEKLKKGDVFSQEVLNYKKSGEKVWISLNITPVRNEVGDVVNFVTIQTDITERKEAEAKQLQLTQDLFNQNRDLQQFTYIVSHNLRSPVAHALGLIDMLSALDKDSHLYEESFSYLKTSIFKLDTVLKDLNMILSVRDKKNIIEKEKVNLAEKCQQVIDDLKEPLQNCNGEVIMSVDESIHVSGNKAYVYSIFHNLVSNAIKYRSSKRTLKINIKASTRKDGGLIISFSDNGSGFDMKKAGENIFKLYKRFHSTSEGRGIGLYLVKTHVESMGGAIEVSSEVNVGTRFLINLR